MNAQQLKNSILQEAIEGRLVPQDPNDEPASVLLDKIRKEKARLVKEGKLKKKDLEEIPISEEDIPFEIPESWEWCRMNYVINLTSGQDLEPSRYSDKANGIPYITGASNFINRSITINRFTITPTSISHFGELLITCKGTVGKMAYNTIGDIHIARQIMSISSPFLFLPYIQYYIEANLPSIEKEARSMIPGISRDTLLSLLIPIPPLAEQHRIVAKIEELLPKVEEYGKAQEALDKLNSELPEKLKKSILQEAITGQLVPQDPNDEPASALLDKIRKEKAKLVKEGKLKKKDLEETPISEDEKPFEIPESWEWVKLGSVAEIARGGSPRPIKDFITEDPDGLNWIKIGDTDKGGKYINSCKEKIKPEGLKKTRMVHPGDFLLTNSMSFGRPYITNIEGCIHDGWLMISPYAGVFIQSYLYYVLSSSFAFKQFNDKVAGAVVQNLNSDKVAESYVPLPTLAEQHRIVAKIEELFAEIDKLKV